VAAAGNGDKLERLGADRATLVRRRHFLFWKVESSSRARLLASLACPKNQGTGKGTRARAEEGKKREIERKRERERSIGWPSSPIELKK
jgi:hypothetical protein